MVGTAVTVHPAGAVEVAGWAAYLTRLLELDDRAAVRLQGVGDVLGVWSGPPFDVVALRPVALAGPAVLDLRVSARRLLEALEQADTDGVVLPGPVPGPSWVGLLPPRSGWAEAGRLDTVAVAAAVASGVVSFRAKADSLSPAQRTTARLDAMAREVWRLPVVGDVPLRAAHAADRLGLLGSEGEVTAYVAGPWRRLSAAGGSVAVRDLDVPGLALLFSR